jgi:uncharacterized membrane protein HdeD (DUF308 family)
MSTQPDALSTPASGARNELSLGQLYAGRAALAIAWAAVFAVVSTHFGAGTKALLVVYPAIDIAASVIDARSQRRLGSGTARLLLINAAVSAGALIALAIAIGDDTAAVLHVFGTWAAVSGLIQLGVVLRRRSLGRQTAMLISGTLSTAAGIYLNVLATARDPKLTSLAGYAALGAILFGVSAYRLRAQARSSARAAGQGAGSLPSGRTGT